MPASPRSTTLAPNLVPLLDVHLEYLPLGHQALHADTIITSGIPHAHIG